MDVYSSNGEGVLSDSNESMNEDKSEMKMSMLDE